MGCKMGNRGKVKGPLRGMTIVNKFLAWFLLVTLVPLFILGYLSFNYNTESAKNEVINNLVAVF